MIREANLVLDRKKEILRGMETEMTPERVQRDQGTVIDRESRRQGVIPEILTDPLEVEEHLKREGPVTLQETQDQVTAKNQENPRSKMTVKDLNLKAEVHLGLDWSYIWIFFHQLHMHPEFASH